MMVIVIVTTFAALIGAPTVGAWRWDHFVTPSRNIRCIVNPDQPALSCIRMNDGRGAVINLPLWYVKRVWWWVPSVRRQFYPFTSPVLHYGHGYIVYFPNSERAFIRCVSLTYGLRCGGYSGSATGLPGFFISRTRIRIWGPTQ